MRPELLLLIVKVLTGSYLIGSIPFGAMAGKIYGVNLLEKGSGSTGTTNVIRNIGFWPGLIVLLCDIGKGAFSAYLGLIVLHDPIYVVLAGIVAMVGHSHSIFLKFKGGKAAATGVGVLLIMNWQVFLIVAGIVILTLILTRYQSLASLLGSGATPVLLYFFETDLVYLVVAVLGVVFIWIKHIPNIKRLLAGTENKIGSKKPAKKK
ncbi:MAG: glycerol-3-phosphate 1-O-acyltransferase PlsY [Candidatus Margulisbacteria bacterium]|nr:glycerol-3-phosphate 1-O-acyltransferase PlsY [Candidatus Margulisiibacteriota bacterium]